MKLYILFTSGIIAAFNKTALSEKSGSVLVGESPFQNAFTQIKIPLKI